MEMARTIFDDNELLIPKADSKPRRHEDGDDRNAQTLCNEINRIQGRPRKRFCHCRCQQWSIMEAQMERKEK